MVQALDIGAFPLAETRVIEPDGSIRRSREMGGRDDLLAEIERRHASPSAATSAMIVVGLDPRTLMKDSLGRGQADRILASVHTRLIDLFGGEAVVATLDEQVYATLCTGVESAAEAASIGRRTLAVLSDPLQIPGGSVTPRVTVGVALVRPGMHDASEILRSGRVALHQATVESLPLIVLDARLRRRILDEANTVTTLRGALSRDEFRLVFQPIVDLDDGRPVAFEALIRWQHPVDGLVGPDRIIGPAERADIMPEVGAWVLEHACRRLATILERFGNRFRPTMHVNVSPRQLTDPRMVDDVVRALRRSNVPPELMCLEVTEEAVLTPGAAEILERLRSMGVSVAFDDFGSGFSNFAQLVATPVDAIKLDRTIIASSNTPRGHAVIEAIGTIGQALEHDLIAEGVETEEQARLLRSCGFRRAQGFLYARPLDSSSLDAWIEEWV